MMVKSEDLSHVKQQREIQPRILLHCLCEDTVRFLTTDSEIMRQLLEDKRQQ